MSYNDFVYIYRAVIAILFFLWILRKSKKPRQTQVTYYRVKKPKYKSVYDKYSMPQIDPKNKKGAFVQSQWNEIESPRKK